MFSSAASFTRAVIHLDRLSANLRLLQSIARDRPMWPAVKANGYGHGAEVVARHLCSIGYTTVCVAHVSEAIALHEAGIGAQCIVLSASLPEHAEALVSYGYEPAVSTREMVDALADCARRAGKRIAVHVKVDTGMGRAGIAPADLAGLLEHCKTLPELILTGLMSHFACADEADKSSAHEQMTQFHHVREMASAYAFQYCHLANSAGIFELPAAHLDAVRPGIAIYGLKPSAELSNPRVAQLQPVLELRSRVTYVKQVPAHTGLSYGHTFRTERASRIATVPIGYGDGLNRSLSNRLDVLIHGQRCAQVGRITMDQCLVDVTDLPEPAVQGDDVTLIGRQGDQEITADEIALKLGTINYEVVTALAARVPRVAASTTACC